MSALPHTLPACDAVERFNDGSASITVHLSAAEHEMVAGLLGAHPRAAEFDLERALTTLLLLGALGWSHLRATH